MNSFIYQISNVKN